jgi:general stress protein 26
LPRWYRDGYTSRRIFTESKRGTMHASHRPMAHTQDAHDKNGQIASVDEKLVQFHELIDDMEIAMMTTVNTDGALVSRPMATQKHAPGGRLWFMTNVESHKLEELDADPRINLAYYKDRTREFVSVSGVARVNRDRATIHELYKPDWRAWLGEVDELRDGGPDDPRIALIEVEPHTATYLKVDRPAPVVLFSVVKGMVTGEPPKVGKVGHLDEDELSLDAQ